MSILGMNARNALIGRVNARQAIMRVNDKWETKKRLADHDVPVPRTIALLEGRQDLMEFDFDTLPDAFAVKPNRGRRGEGIMLAVRRAPEGGARWITPGDKTFDGVQLNHHIAHVLDAEFSLEGAQSDSALIEPLIVAHDGIARLVPYGLPDVRIICYRDTPLMAMARLPTEQSGGKANLHQGAVGAGIDLDDGTIHRAVHGRRPIETHPSTGVQLVGAQLPMWSDILDAARRCSAPLELGYVGVDIVIDRDEGVKVLECNAFPGLEIQNINARGLKRRLDRALHAEREARRAEREAA